MKKILYIMLAATLVFTMTACGGETTDKKDSSTGKKVEKSKEQGDKEKNKKKKKEKKTDKSSKEKKKAKKPISEFDKTKKGKDLVKQLVDLEIPKNYFYDGELRIKNEKGPETKIAIKAYIVGDSSCIESNMTGTDSVTIHDADKHVEYSYNVKTKKGQKVKSEDAPESAIEVLLNQASETKFESIVDAKIDKLDDKEVLYIEEKEGGGLVKTWYSTEFFCPLKMQAFNENKVLINEFVVKEIKGGDYSDKIKPDKDIQFDANDKEIE